MPGKIPHRRTPLVAWLKRGAMIGAAATVLALSGCVESTLPTAGAVVENCTATGAAARAGMHENDLVAGWRCGELSGVIRSPIDLSLVEQEACANSAVTLSIIRKRNRFEVELPGGLWNIETRPILPGPIEKRYELMRTQESIADFDAMVRHWGGLAQDLSAADNTEAAAWCQIKLAAYLLTNNHTEEALAAFDTGAAYINDRQRRAVFWQGAGRVLNRAGNQQAANHTFQTSLEIFSEIDRRSMAAAFTMLELSNNDHRNNFSAAEDALNIYRTVDSASFATGRALYELALCFYVRSQYDRVEDLGNEALIIFESCARFSELHVLLLQRLGLTMLRLGDYDAARQHFYHQLAAAQSLEPDGPLVGDACNNLGLTAKRMGDYQTARSFYEQGMEIFRQHRPDGAECAGMLNNLGNISTKVNDFKSALKYHQEALSLRQQLQPAGREVAASLNNLGMTERSLGDLVAARDHLERAMALKFELSPGTITLTNTMCELGMVAVEEGRYDEAHRLYEESRIICERLTPGNPFIAELLFLKGALAEKQGHQEDAEQAWRQAIAAFEELRSGFDVSEDERSRFGSRYYDCYGALARLLASNGRSEEAFVLMESARARALRTMVISSQSIPEGVPGRLWTTYEKTLKDLARIRTQVAHSTAGQGAGSNGSTSDSTAEFNRLEVQRDRLAAQILVAAPRLAELETRDEALSLDEVRTLLDPGTVVLSYLVGKSKTVLFVIQAAADSKATIHSFTIPVAEAELERRVDVLRAFITRGRYSSAVDPALITQARRLFDILIGPAMAQVSGAQRLLIIPDGPLRQAPFAALVTPGEAVHYLGEWKAMFTAPSAGAVIVLANRRRQRDPLSSAPVVVFGDPVYPPRSPIVRAKNLQPLFGSRSEALGIAEVFGEDALVYLGSDASEQQFRSLPRQIRYLHLAVHAQPDGRFPMESALFLSNPAASGDAEERDGVLHAREIMDSIVLHADVVTLSGCSTAGGQRVAGEGIIGLARAFQYAGASTVVASLWQVGDQSTAQLMKRFYDGLDQGLSPAEALREAQRDLLAGPLRLLDGSLCDYRHPFHWAAFQVMGDWL